MEFPSKNVRTNTHLDERQQDPSRLPVVRWRLVRPDRQRPAIMRSEAAAPRLGVDNYSTLLTGLDGACMGMMKGVQ